MGQWFIKDKLETKKCGCGCGIDILRWKDNLTERFFCRGHENKGKKQSSEHIRKRIKYGEGHYLWKGEKSLLSRTQGRRTYPRVFEGIRITILHFVPTCQMCMESKSVLVHHTDGDTYNNQFNNLLALCQKCHHQCHYARKSTAY